MEIQNQKTEPKKKKIRRQVYEKIAAALEEYKSSFKEKRFEANVKKASRLFANDLAKTTRKNKIKSKKNQAKAKKEMLTATNGVV